MAKKTSPEDILNAPLPDADELLRLQREAAEQFTSSMQEWSSRIAEINQEMVEFMQKRAETNQGMLESLIECRDAEALSQLHSDWMRSAISDYTKEMQRAMELYTHSLLLPLQAVSKAAKASDDKPGKARRTKKRPAA